MRRAPALREAVLGRLRALGQHAGPPDHVPFDVWKKHLAALCRDGVIRKFAWEIDGERFEAKLVGDSPCPNNGKPLPLYVAGVRW
jgi:hypothetical protein